LYHAVARFPTARKDWIHTVIYGAAMEGAGPALDVLAAGTVNGVRGLRQAGERSLY
jgi:hypothetical protein